MSLVKLLLDNWSVVYPWDTKPNFDKDASSSETTKNYRLWCVSIAGSSIIVKVVLEQQNEVKKFITQI